MKWWIVTLQTLILIAIAITAGIVQSNIADDERAKIEKMVPVWHKQAASSWKVLEQQSPLNLASNNEGTITPTPAVDDDTNADATGTMVGDGSAPFDPATLEYVITLDQSRQCWNYYPEEEGGKEFVFVDARPYVDYKEGHIDGAISMSLHSFDEMAGLPVHMENGVIDPASTILIVYCKGGDCDESLLAAGQLEDIGFTCHIFEDGYPAWVNANFETLEGSDEWLIAFDAEPQEH